MASPRFVYDAIKRRFKDSAIGRWLTKRQLVKVRDTAATVAEQQMRDLAARAVRGEIATDAFRASFRAAVRAVNASQYILGRGGVNALSAQDFRNLSGILRAQGGYLDGFAGAIERGELSEAQAMARAESYAGSGVKAFEVGQASAWGIDRALPTYPGDDCEGSSRCRCSWSLEETDDGVECTWTLGGADPCDPCRQNAAAYNPLVLPRPYAGSPDPVRLTVVRRAGEMPMSRAPIFEPAHVGMEWSGSPWPLTGEDIHRGDYVCWGPDGRVYRAVAGQPWFGPSLRDVKADERFPLPNGVS